MKRQIRSTAARAEIRRQTELTATKFPKRKVKSKVKPKAKKEIRLSRTLPPAELTPVEWQRALRRQFGREQAFKLTNLGEDPFFSEFRVANPASKSAYRVAIRGVRPGDNFCSCPDYSTNELGTCKHVEREIGQGRSVRVYFFANVSRLRYALWQFSPLNPGGLRLLSASATPRFIPQADLKRS